MVRLEFSVRKLVISRGRLVWISMEQEFIYRTYGSFKDLVKSMSMEYSGRMTEK